MIKISITRQGVVTNQAQFPTQPEAEAWFNEVAATGAFGKPERWVSEDRLAVEGEDPALAVQTMVEPISGQDVKLFKFAAEFTHAFTDISAEIALEKKRQERKLKRAFGEQLIDEVSLMNEAKGLQPAQVDVLMASPLLKQLQDHLWAGNIETFVAVLTPADVSQFFTTQEKAAVLAKCTAFLQSLEA